MKRIFVLLAVLFSVGFSENLTKLGVEAYDRGDHQKAAQLCQKDCDEENAFSCGILGSLYAEGKGLRQDYQKAVHFYQKACDGGEAKKKGGGCYNLGFLYINGQGIGQNFSTAKEYYGKACDLGLQLGCDDYRKLNEKGY